MGSVFTLAQDRPASLAPEGLEPPPPIAFDAWQPTEATEFWERYQLSFPTARRSGIANNDVVPMVITMPTERVGRVPVVMLMHYWGATDLALENELSARLAERNIASVIVTLPYHLGRTPPGFRSGERAITANPLDLVETMRQAVSDVRRAIDFVETRPEFDTDRIGVAGTSLGALVSALTFAVEPRTKAGAFVLGGVDLAHIYWNSGRTAPLRNELRRAGYTEDRLREELAPIEPLNYLDPQETRPSFLVRARYDSIVPPAASQNLLNALPDSQVLTLETGHYGGVLVQSRLLRTTASFFDTTFRGEAFSAPAFFFSPTLRVGVVGGGGEPFTFFGGLDVWRADKNGKGFATFMITPQGPRGFLGYRLTRETALGLYATPKRTTWGFFWNFVL